MLEKKSSALLLSVLSAAIISTPGYAHHHHHHADSQTAIVATEIAAPAPLITIPDLKPGVEVSVTALALKPSASNLNYAIFNKALPAQAPGWTEEELNPNYAPAFALGVRYIFGNQSGNDVSIDWTHLNSNTSATVTANGSSFFIGPDYEIGPDAIEIRMAKGSVNFKYDVVNLMAGQFLDFGKHVEMHFFGGLSVGSLREEQKSTYSGTILLGTFAGNPFSTASDNTSNFTGVGPRIGMQMAYNMDCGFGFLGESAVSALIGGSHAALRFNSSGPEINSTYAITNNPQSIVDQNTTQVIPGFDAKVGISYKRMLSNAIAMNIQAGYQAAVYINAINQYKPATLVTSDAGPQDIQTGGIFVATMSHTQSNYSVQGPFLKFALQF